ncbi:MAG: agmatinase [Chloroflexi bacterium]|nr:agmatinase [Chloroflexota bacterium]
MPLQAPPPEARFWGSGSEQGARSFLFGAPLDLTGSGRLGTGQAPSAVRRASHNIESYSPRQDADLADCGFADLGDLRLDGLAMEAALTEIERQAALVLANGVPIVVGGEHTIALAIGRAVKQRHPDALIVSLDAHLDLADELNDLKVAHGTWVCRLGEELGDYEDFIMLGMRSGTRDEWQRSLGCRWVSPEVILPDHLRAVVADRPIYLSVDIDVLDPSAAPGTGTPEPPGITSRELFSFLYSLRGLNVVAMDVNEILPEVDPAGITAITGAKLIREAAIQLGR